MPTTDSEARLLWATNDEATTGELVRRSARDLAIHAQICSPQELFDVLRPTRFDFVGIELGAEPRAGLALVRQAHDRFPRLAIVAAVHDSSVPAMRAALEAGASDILSLPLSQPELQKVLIKLRQTKSRDVGTHAVTGAVYSIHAARGGLGATTTAVNLAVQLAGLTSTSVALADLDLQRGDVTTYLNLSHTESIASMASSPGEVDEIFLHGTLSRHASGISVLPAPQQIEEAEAVGHDEVRLAVTLLRAQFRYTVIDTPQMITGATAAAFELSDHVVLITDLSIPSVRSARRFVDLLQRLGVRNDRVELVVTELIRGPVELKDLTRSLGKEPIAVLPSDSAAGQSMNSGAPLNGAKPTSLTTAIAGLATKLSGVQPQGSGRGSLFKRIFAKEATS